MTEVEQAIAEILARLAEFAPVLEGLRDYQRLNLQPATQTEIADAIADYERRVAKLQATVAALQDLLADGHPDLPVREISQSALRDLQENASTIQAALAKFATNAATTLGLAGGAVEPR